MKKLYTNPELVVIALDMTDIVTASAPAVTTPAVTTPTVTEPPVTEPSVQGPGYDMNLWVPGVDDNWN